MAIGDHVYIAPRCKVVCRESVVLGDYIEMSWESQIFDSHFHYIIKDGIIYNMTKQVRIQHHVWIGNRVSIMPGAQLGPYSILGADSMLNKDYSDVEAGLFVGRPAKLVKQGCYRLRHKLIEKDITKWFKEHENQTEYVIEMRDELFENGMEII